MSTQAIGKVPARFWIIALLSLAWNSFGAVDYTLSEMGNRPYLEGVAGLGPEELAFIAGLPAWAVAAWAIGVWGSLAGSVLLLLRSRHAVTAFAVSLVGAVISFAYQYTSAAMPASMKSGVTVIAPIVILLLIAVQWIYARRMAAAGVLR
ncbi:MAG: hypothetical protein ABIT16_03745 [Croceibacterium sp.]